MIQVGPKEVKKLLTLRESKPRIQSEIQIVPEGKVSKALEEEEKEKHKNK